MSVVLMALAFVAAMLATLTVTTAADLTGRYVVTNNGATSYVDLQQFGKQITGTISGAGTGPIDATMTSDTVFMGSMFLDTLRDLGHPSPRAGHQPPDHLDAPDR